MTMNAVIIRVQPGSLLVNDLSNNQEVLVHYRSPNCFSSGDNIKITYDGRMTFSIPPQITASSIQLIHPAAPPQPPHQSTPAETRVTVIQQGRGFLMVRNIRNSSLMRVNYPNAHHFCVGQRIIVKYDSIIMSNPAVINALDIIPVC